MAKCRLPPPTWADYLAGRAALLKLMTPTGRLPESPPDPMNAALMTAHPGGAAAPAATPLTVTKAPRALHIDPRILAQPDLELTECALLAEVLDLYQAKGQVFASNDHFAARCKCSERTVRSAIAKLQQAGYLERDLDHKRTSKRLLVPTEKWQILPEVVAEFAGTTPEVVANSAGSSGRICRNTRQNLPEVVANSATINTSLNTKANTNLNRPDAAADAAGPGAEKKIGQEVAPESSPRPASRPKRPAGRAAEPEHFAGFWAAWPKKEARADAVRAFAKLSPADQAAAAARAAGWLAARPDLADRARYRFIPHPATWLNQERWTDAAPTAAPAAKGPPVTTTHANYDRQALAAQQQAPAC